jgi:hypothetical protein
MGARQYSPTIGRFLEVDPIEGGSVNAYDYVDADPINGRDLAGTCGTFGNPFKKCGKGHKKHRGFLGGAFTKPGRWVRHRWNEDTTAFGVCLPFICVQRYTYRDKSGRRHWKSGVTVGPTSPGPFVSSTSGRPGAYPTASWSAGYGVCGGRSSFARGYNFTGGLGRCDGLQSGP